MLALLVSVFFFEMLILLPARVTKQHWPLPRQDEAAPVMPAMCHPAAASGEPRRYFCSEKNQPSQTFCDFFQETIPYSLHTCSPSQIVLPCTKVLCCSQGKERLMYICWELHRTHTIVAWSRSDPVSFRSPNYISYSTFAYHPKYVLYVKYCTHCGKWTANGPPHSPPPMTWQHHAWCVSGNLSITTSKHP